MKKILFRKLLFECLLFLFISSISAATIIWVFQAVNYLDIIIEDGRDYKVYLLYSFLSYPKILSKILPFTAFFSFFYVISKYEIENELIIFWNFGINKILLIKFFLKFSFILMIVQIIFSTFLVPITQNYSRTIIKSSNVDFYESLIKPKKFSDNINSLTIYVEEKDKNGFLKNIYLKKENESENFQITHSKKGKFEEIDGINYLILFDGQTINKINNNINSFNFSQSDFSLSEYGSATVTSNKIQETRTRELITCLTFYFNKDLTLNINQKSYINHNCSFKSLINVFQELYKRFIIPIYIPILILISLMLIIQSKENKNYKKFKIFIFMLGFLIIVFSETSLRFVSNTFQNNFILIILPILILLSLYFYFRFKFIKYS